MSDAAPTQPPEDLIDILNRWIETETWEKSREMLEQHHELLLSDDAFALLDTRLSESAVSSEENNDEIEVLKRHRTLLETARGESIEVAYAFTLETSLLVQAIEAMLGAQNSAELFEQVEQHPILLTQEGIEAIARYIEQLQQDNQTDIAEALQERFDTLIRAIESAASSNDTESDDLTKLLLQWIHTPSWNESRTMLAANAGLLLTDDAIAALDTLLAINTDNEGATKILRQHRVMLETARMQSIDAAYSDLLMSQPLEEAFAAIYQANGQGDLYRAIALHPILLDDHTLQILLHRVDEIEQTGNVAVAKALRMRLEEVQRIRQPQEPTRREISSSLLYEDEPRQIDIGATERSIAVGRITDSSIQQININLENYRPEMKWLPPKRQAFKDRKTFVGRDELVKKLTHYLIGGENVAITGVVQTATLRGMGGIGKTYLARKLAIELQDTFPGGCIWLDLGPSVRERADIKAPLSQLVKRVFNGDTPIPLSGDFDLEMVASWLEQTAPGRMLVVLDDVWHQEPLRLLDQALPANAVRLITTRYARIADTMGGYKETLSKLSITDGLTLIEDRLNCPHDSPYQDTLTQLVKLLDGHALALDIAAALIEKPAHIDMILKKLEDGIGRGELANLRIPQYREDEEERDTNLEKSLALSYDMMNVEQRRRFRTLGIFAPETPITTEVAAAIWNMEELEEAQTALDELESLALLTEDPDALTLAYRLHGLLQVYAHALLEHVDELRGASWAHAQYYATIAWQAEQATPKDYPLLDQHIQNLLTALKWSIDNEPNLFTELLDGSTQFFLLRGQSELLEKYLPEAIEVADTLGNQVRQANLLQSLGDLERRLGNIDQARAHYDAALPLYQAERSKYGETGVYMSLGDIFIAQREWAQAQTYYEQALALFVIERDPLGQANTLIDLGSARFELGDHDQGMDNVRQAATLFLENRQDEWVQRAHLSIIEMRVRTIPRVVNIETFVLDEKLLKLFATTESMQDMLDLVKQHPQLLLISRKKLPTPHDDKDINQHLDESIEMLVAVRSAVLQQSRAAKVLADFAQADWETRHQMLTKQATVLLNEQIEPVIDLFIWVDAQDDSDIAGFWESLHTLLRRCRTWGSDAVFYFELYMRLGDAIDIPPIYEVRVMQIAILLLNQEGDANKPEQAIEMMQALLDQLTSGTPQLFEAALLYDLARTIYALPKDHPKRKEELIVNYCQEALSLYPAATWPLTIAFLQSLLGDILIEQGRYEEALEPLAVASQTLLIQEGDQTDAVAPLSSYAFVLNMLQRTEEALQAYNQAIELLPDSSALLYARATILIHARRLDDAEDDLKRAAELDGNEASPELWLYRAQLAVARGDGSLTELMLNEVRTRSDAFNLTLLHAQGAWLRGEISIAQEALQTAFDEADEGDRTAIRREMQQLFAEHPDLPMLNYSF